MLKPTANDATPSSPAASASTATLYVRDNNATSSRCKHRTAFSENKTSNPQISSRHHLRVMRTDMDS